MSYQQMTIVGNLGNTPEMRPTPSGKAMTNLSVAINEGSGDKKTTTWVNVTCFDKLAETAVQYLTKGREVLVVGRAKARAYKDKNGEPAASLDVIADRVVFVGSGGQQGVVTANESGVVNEDQIPF